VYERMVLGKEQRDIEELRTPPATTTGSASEGGG